MVAASIGSSRRISGTGHARCVHAFANTRQDPHAFVDIRHLNGQFEQGAGPAVRKRSGSMAVAEKYAGVTGSYAITSPTATRWYFRQEHPRAGLVRHQRGDEQVVRIGVDGGGEHSQPSPRTGCSTSSSDSDVEDDQAAGPVAKRSPMEPGSSRARQYLT